MGEELAFNAGDTEDMVSIPGQEDALEKETESYPVVSDSFRLHGL